MEKWLDREKIKSKLSDWLASDTRHFLLTIEDSQEFEDVTRWLEDLEGFNAAIAYLNTDSAITRFGLLEEIIDGFGRENFPDFNVLYNSICAIDPKIIINQKIGTEINAITTDVSANTQNVKIDKLDFESVRVFYIEDRINEFLDSFLANLRNIDYGYTNLIICRFRGTGFNRLDDKFKSWFQDQFIRKLKTLRLKMIVLCELNEGNLTNVFDYSQQYRLNNLHLDEVIPVSKDYLNDTDGLFCKGAVGADNTIAYKDFKIKLQNNMIL